MFLVFCRSIRPLVPHTCINTHTYIYSNNKHTYIMYIRLYIYIYIAWERLEGSPIAVDTPTRIKQGFLNLQFPSGLCFRS